MTNVTYLLGAGASRNALPIVSEFKERIDECIKVIEEDEFMLTNEDKYFEKYIKREVQEEFITNLRWLSAECDRHASIDTFAKKLFLTRRNDDLDKLKYTLHTYLLFEQAISQPDSRYDSFFASIIQSKINELPENIRIISWNYDIQLEMTYKNIAQLDNYDNIQDMLNIISKYVYRIRDLKKFSIFKLNGTTSIFDERKVNRFIYVPNIPNKIGIKLIDSLLYYYSALIHQSTFHTCLSFAWEEDDSGDSSIIEKATEGTKDSEVMVVIGYSFPFFNREIDRKIIGSMGKLKKVYFQSPDAEDLIERFHSIREDLPPDKLIPKFKVNQFYLPNEL